jgi:hypothetical protein
MSNDDVVLRQQRLLARSAQLRLILSDQTQALRKPLSWVDQAISGMAWLRHNPQWPLGAVLVLAVVRPRGAIRWASRLWWGWQSFKRVRQWLESNSIRI